MNHPFQLILLPGVGADHRLFVPQRPAFLDLLVPAWIAPKKHEGLADYAARLAQRITPAKPMVLGGSSFGGMVACEMAKVLKPDVVVLIASCRSRKGIRPLFRVLRPTAPVAPKQVFDVAKLLSPMALRMLGRLTPEQRRLCVTMFRDADSRFMKWACTAVLNWEPSLLRGIPVFQIHGEKDLIIPARGVEADEIVPGGGHLINLTHAGQVNAFIARVFRVAQ